MDIRIFAFRHNRAHEQLVRDRALRHIHPLGSLLRCKRGWELSWPLVGGSSALPGGQSVDVEEYHSTAKTFNPVKFDAREVARRAKRAGMQYGVLITKHHDGYAMFHTREADWGIEHSPYQKDIVRQYVDAFRAEGLKVGFYFSLLDWHHPDYPAFTDADKPYRWGHWRRSSPEAWDRFLKVMFGQMRELLTNYGKIDLLWFDGGWERTPEEWKAAELEKMIRELQPDIIINDRLPGCGDYVTPEQAIPATPPKGPWETCMTINDSWGYNPSDRAPSSRRATSSMRYAKSRARAAICCLMSACMRGDGALPPEQIGIASRFFAGVDGAPSGEHRGHHRGSGNVAVLWTLDAARRSHLSASADASPTNRFRCVAYYVKRVKAKVTVHLEPARSSDYAAQISAVDQMFNKDPVGELVIQVPESVIDAYSTVIAVDF